MMSTRCRSSWRVQSKFFAASLGVALSLFHCHVPAQAKDNSQLIAQTSNLGPVTALGTQSARKRKRSIITDSLWGNLILEYAYERDPELSKLGVGVKLMNIGTQFAITSIAGGTLFQGIYAMAALNPPAPHQDSYVPGITGIVLSSATVLTLGARMFIGHELGGHIRKRQMELRDQVETLLARLEDTHCDDTVANMQLRHLIGERASGEWLQMWRATHVLSTEAHRVGMETPASPKLMATAGNSEGGIQQ